MLNVITRSQGAILLQMTQLLIGEENSYNEDFDHTTPNHKVITTSKNSCMQQLWGQAQKGTKSYANMASD